MKEARWWQLVIRLTQLPAHRLTAAVLVFTPLHVLARTALFTFHTYKPCRAQLLSGVSGSHPPLL